MTTLRRILIVDDDPPSQRLLQVRVRAIGCQVTVASDGQEALAAIEQELPDLMLLDLEMPRMGGMELLRTLKQRGMDLPIIVVTAHGSIDAAVEAMKEGAYDFIPKPFDPKHLEIVVRKVLEREELKRDIEILTEEADRRYRLVIGESRRMNDAVETVRKAAPSKASILLLGESGTGKEIFARAIHSWSERKDKPFIAINCVGLSKELLESELFGHEKGAFTGALLLKKGKMELAHGGTVFLDEIGDVVQELQTKLLRFLQEREFERVGGTKQIQVDVRIIAATNRDLATAISQGRFREDLFHRLNVIPVTLPPLRQRPEDIPALVDHFIDKFSKEAKKQFSGISQEALVSLTRYDWPGNVRELANVIERSVVLGSGPMLMPHHLPASILASVIEQKSDNLSYRESMEVHRRSLLLAAVDRAHGNRAAAARSLGLHEKYLLRLLKSLGIGG